jgi:hypothetical protein
MKTETLCNNCRLTKGYLSKTLRTATVESECEVCGSKQGVLSSDTWRPAPNGKYNIVEEK